MVFGRAIVDQQIHAAAIPKRVAQRVTQLVRRHRPRLAYHVVHFVQHRRRFTVRVLAARQPFHRALQVRRILVYGVLHVLRVGDPLYLVQIVETRVQQVVDASGHHRMVGRWG